MDACVQPELFSMSIGDNIKYGLENVTQEQVEEVRSARTCLYALAYLSQPWYKLTLIFSTHNNSVLVGGTAGKCSRLCQRIR